VHAIRAKCSIYVDLCRFQYNGTVRRRGFAASCILIGSGLFKVGTPGPI
jgi:hypothetical protein